MISFPVIVGADGGQLVQQKMTHPAVYLDTWAIRHFAENGVAGAKFRAAVLASGGTLVLSDLSFADFTSFADARHARAAGRFVDSLHPHLFFSQFDPFKIMPREIAVMVGQTRESPAGDLEVLQRYAQGVQRIGRPCLHEWFDEVHRGRDRLKPGLTNVAREFFKAIEAARSMIDAQESLRRSAHREIANSGRPRATLALLRAILFRLEADRKTKLKANDAVDAMQCIVPASYCDFVLLDRSWCARLNAARAWLAEAGIASHVAECFDKPRAEDFLQALAAWPNGKGRNQ